MRLHSALCRTSALVVGVLFVVPVLLTGCKDSSSSEPAETGGGPAAQTSDAQGSASSQASPEPDGKTATEASEEATPTPSPTPECSDKSGAEALGTWVSQVPTYYEQAWDTTEADVSTYDSCASLSWIVLPIEGGTASSPYQIMLFHHGEYIGVTSDQMIGFFPEVARLDDETIQVTYKWPRDGESTAGASGRSVSVFTWDEITRAVVHSGEWPPTIDK